MMKKTQSSDDLYTHSNGGDILGCPFLSGRTGSVPAPSPSASPAMSKMHHQHEDFGKVSVDDLIPQLVHKTLGMPEVDCAQWIAKLRGHLIGNVYALSRLSVQQLQSLGLPLALEAELCSVVQKYNPASTPVPSQPSPSISRSGSEEFGTHAIRKKRSSKKMREEAKTEAEKAALLGLTAETRQALKESWATVTQQRGAELNKFFEEFYGHFLKVDRLARHLFAGASMTRQAQALMKVMSAVMSALDNPAKLIGPLKKLGCRHLIYGVERKNFQSWGISLAKTFEAVLGPEKGTPAIKEAWYVLIQTLGEIMMDDYDEIRAGYKGELFVKDGNKWRYVYTMLYPDRLCIFKDAERTKIKYEIDVTLLDGMEVEDGELPGKLAKATPFCFSVTAQGTIKTFFCCNDDDELLYWTEELTERIKSHQRVAQTEQTEKDGVIGADDEESSDERSGSFEKRSGSMSQIDARAASVAKAKEKARKKTEVLKKYIVKK